MKQPLRPALPLLLLPLAVAWVGITGASELLYQGYTLDPLLPFSGAALSIVAVGWWFAQKRTLSPLLLSVLTLCLSLGSGSLFYTQTTEHMQESPTYSGTQELIIIEDTQHNAGSQGSEALLVQAHGEQVRMRVFWNDAEISLPKGSHISAWCTFTALREDQRWLFERGVAGTLSLTEISERGFPGDLWGFVDSFRQHNVALLTERGGEGAALMAGVLLGYRESLQDTIVEQDFLTCGLTHLIAVSGSHLAVVAVLVSWFLRLLPLGRVSEVVILLAILALYVMLTGLQPSAIRSALMAAVAGCSVFVGRRGHAPSALTAAALIMLLVYPAHAFSLGFWLSVFAVLGITLFANLVASWVSTAAPIQSREGPGALSSALALTVTASTATIPLVVPTFAVYSLIGPLANLLAAPLVSLALSTGMLALVIAPVCAPLGTILLDLSLWVSDITASVASLLAQVPWASVPVHIPSPAALILCFSLGALLYFLWPMPSAKILRGAALCSCALVCFVAFVVPLFGPARLVVMDIGQGDALLVQEQGHTLLVDTGASETALVHALARNGVRNLDAVIITHLDDDHAGALKRLRGLMPVERVYFAYGLVDSQRDNAALTTAQSLVGADQVNELMCGDRLRLGRTLSLLVLWPDTRATEGSNSESLCLLLQYDANGDGSAEQQALLTGDAESQELQQIVQNNAGLTASLIKIGHHGSKDAITPELLNQLGTTVALISVGANNRYGHPAAHTLSLLIDSGVKVLRTDENGDICCLFRNDTFELSCATMGSEIR